ncbi:uncharacterized protein [Phyllobates terribilis]|uniref:uncharacterized protein n=1 Tax=Phyllobates terribilis TaxID=111132 RepID=UPI003CCB4C9B
MEYTRRNHFFSPSTPSYSSSFTCTQRSNRTGLKAKSEISPSLAVAAAKIQAAYRSHVVRRLVKKISSIQLETERLQRLIQRQETVDALRSDQRERLRINEVLMRQLLALDSISGFDPAVREARRTLSRRIVGLQEIVDGICNNKVAEIGINGWDGGWREWDDALEEIEMELCRERGGDELEKFCAEKLGFRCFQRFLRH